MRARVFVRLKSGVLDPQGEAIERALHGLGFAQAHGVRVGKVIEMEVDGTDAEACKKSLEAMADQLLANPVIEAYRVEVDAAGKAP